MVRINGKLVQADVELMLSPTGVVLISIVDHSNRNALDFAVHSTTDADRIQVARAAQFYRFEAKEFLEG